MSLSLPNPNLVFVPLDVLTAEELNNMMSDISFIANQFPIASTNIGTRAVKKTNVDWSNIVTKTTGTNGTVLTFPDGFKIEYGTISQSLNINTSYEGSYFGAIENVAFPVAFTSTPTIITNTFQSQSLLSTTVSELTASRFNTYIWKQTSKNGVLVSLNWVAFGYQLNGATASLSKASTVNAGKFTVEEVVVDAKALSAY